MLQADEINILLEAMDSWSRQDVKDELLFSMITAGLSRTENEAKQGIEQAHLRIEQGKDARRLKEERATLIKAKLIKMRDLAEVQEFTQSAIK